MNLALFDLDHTLLDGDSDHEWALFLAEIGVLDQTEQNKMQAYYCEQYKAGVLDMQEYLDYQLQPLRQHSSQDLLRWREQYVEEIVKPMIHSGKPELLEPHRENGDKLVIITATNDFVTEPIAKLLNVDTLLATNVEKVNGEHTGKTVGTACFQEGKITKLEQWLTTQEEQFNTRYFYSDSNNDLPLLQAVDIPIAVNPDKKLREFAEKSDWKIID